MLSHDPACTLTARDYKGPLQEADLSTVVAYGLSTQQEPKWQRDVAPTLALPSKSGGGQPTAVAFAQNQRGEVRTSPVSLQLTTGGGKPGEGYPAVMTPQAVAFDACGSQVQTDQSGVAPPLRANAGGHAAIAFDTTQITSPANLRASSGGSSRSYVLQPWAVRRLTPTECERLQGFEDGFTSIPYRNKPADQCPGGPRYKALGNSWAINCGEYIFDRIKLVEAL